MLLAPDEHRAADGKRLELRGKGDSAASPDIAAGSRAASALLACEGGRGLPECR